MKEKDGVLCFVVVQTWQQVVCSSLPSCRSAKQCRFTNQNLVQMTLAFSSAKPFLTTRNESVKPSACYHHIDFCLFLVAPQNAAHQTSQVLYRLQGSNAAERQGIHAQPRLLDLNVLLRCMPSGFTEQTIAPTGTTREPRSWTEGRSTLILGCLITVVGDMSILPSACRHKPPLPPSLPLP